MKIFAYKRKSFGVIREKKKKRNGDAKRWFGCLRAHEGRKTRFLESGVGHLSLRDYQLGGTRLSAILKLSTTVTVT